MLLKPLHVGDHAGKSYARRRDGTIDARAFQGARYNEHMTADIDGFDDLAALLASVEENGAWFAVRGELAPSAVGKRVIRRLLHDDGGDKATFVERSAGHHWLAVDVDHCENVWGVPTSVDEMEALTAGVVRATLPACFWTASYWYQWSNSMGVYHGDWNPLKLHLWFWLARPYTDSVLAQWASTLDGIDDAVYRTVQANYIAKPRFAGMDDPLKGKRSGVVRGRGAEAADAVTLDYTFIDPAVFDFARRERVRAWQRDLRRDGVVTYDYDHVSPALQRIAEIGVDGHLHLPLCKSAASWIVSCGRDPDRDAWKALARERIAVSGHPDAGRRAADRYLNQIWESGLRRFSPFDPAAPCVPRDLLPNANKFFS